MTQPPHGESSRGSSIAAAEAPQSDFLDAPPQASDFLDAPPQALDFIDAPPPAELPEWPPVGAYPGEPGYVFAEPFAADDTPTATFEPIVDPPVEGEVLIGEPVWHQPPPTEPFHARHEKPGEWRTEPPEHLAWEHSPPAEVQPGVQHDQPTEAIPLSMLPHSWEVPFDPHTTETVVLEPPPKHKRPFWVAVALVLTLLIFGGGTVSAYLLLRDAESGRGAPDPATAVDRFMTAVYTQQDPVTAGNAVCREARDADQLKARVDQIKGYANEYDAPSFKWNGPAIQGQTDERATVGVQLTMTTDDEKTAQQQLTFTVVRKTGWLVCDVKG